MNSIDVSNVIVEQLVETSRTNPVLKPAWGSSVKQFPLFLIVLFVFLLPSSCLIVFLSKAVLLPCIFLLPSANGFHLTNSEQCLYRMTFDYITSMLHIVLAEGIPTLHGRLPKTTADHFQ